MSVLLADAGDSTESAGVRVLLASRRRDIDAARQSSRATSGPLAGARAHRVDAVAAQDAATAEQAPPLPIREAKLGPVERLLTVDPSRVPFADERRVGGRVEALVLGGDVADQAGDELRAVPVEEVHRVSHVAHEDERDLGGAFPFPFAAELARR